ncbi:MAG: hypothetical protein JWP87_4602 [Labilithrix sp.]|nr:hypothetical protein [Labilithrix sp.]
MHVVAVETHREPDGALLVATARGGTAMDPSSAPPFVFDRDAEGRFVACLVDRAASSAVQVVVERSSVRVAWIGALEALLVRRGEIVHRTAPGQFWTQLSAPERRELTIDRGAPWPIEPGDLLLLCSAKVHHLLSEADVTALANRDDIGVIVRGLVTTTSTRGELGELCAVAIRIVDR